MRYATFVWDADGDMGDAVVLGTFKTEGQAEFQAERVRGFTEREGRPSINALVVPIIHPHDTSMSIISDRVFGG